MSTCRIELRYRHELTGCHFIRTIACLSLRIVAAAGFLMILLFQPARAQVSDLTYTTNDGVITITGYTGLEGDLTIPNLINGLPVTTIGESAFDSNTSLTNVVIADGITNIGSYAFSSCENLVNVSLPDRVASIGSSAFSDCISLTNVAIPTAVATIESDTFSGCTSLAGITFGAGVTSIGNYAFRNCTSLTTLNLPAGLESIGSGGLYSCSSLVSVTLPDTLTSIENYAFAFCNNLTGVYFRGNAPTNVGQYLFTSDAGTIYYLPGTSGWNVPFPDLPTALWLPRVSSYDPLFGVRTNCFGFTLTWAQGNAFVVEICTNLNNPIWVPTQTNILTGDSFYFSDQTWTNSVARFYRVQIFP